ncbi:MAG: hypothetical protein ACAI38_23160 [Myxococcota bacterium]|nr:hypothetical protein [Myxococcota bacterium]
MRELIALMLILCLGAASPSFIAAQRAYDAVRYDDAEALLYRAANETNDAKELTAIYELLATIHLVRNRDTRAVDAMTELLTRVPTYVPSADNSPKIWEAYRRARNAQLAAAQARQLEQERAAAQAALVAPAPPPPTHWYASPWVWVGVGVVVAAATTFIVVRYANPSAPDGDFGPIELR